MWQENINAAELFSTCGRLWRYGAMGHLLGLDRCEMRAHFELMQVTFTPDVYHDIMAIENGFVEAINQK